MTLEKTVFCNVKITRKKPCSLRVIPTLVENLVARVCSFSHEAKTPWRRFAHLVMCRELCGRRLFV